MRVVSINVVRRILTTHWDLGSIEFDVFNRGFLTASSEVLNINGG